MSTGPFADKAVMASPVIPPKNPLNGIDVSHYQAVIDWQKVKASGIDFVFIKSTELLDSPQSAKDPLFDMHWMNAKANGLIRGAYHFFHPSVDAVTQAQLMATVVGKLDADDLPCVVDVEASDNKPAQIILEHLCEFLGAIQALTGKQPIIYGNVSFLNALNLDAETFGDFPLWIAHPDTLPTLPKPWTVWSFWQNVLDNGTVPGIDGGMDLDLFNGTREQLLKIAHGG